MTYEQKLEKLNEIVSALDNEKLPLDDALELYKEGITLSAECKKELENAKQQVKILDSAEENNNA